MNDASFRRLLVGFDGSDRAVDALALAQRLIDPQNGLLLLAFVEAGRAFRMPLRRAAPEAGEVLGAAHAQIAIETSVTEFVRTTGSVARGLTALAEQQRADLVVIGSSRPALIGRILPGLAALRLLHGAPCGFSIAPAARSAAGRFRHVGIAYDGSPEAAGALTAGYELAARDGAAVSLYYVNVASAVAPAGGSGPELDPADQRPRLAAQERLDAAAGAAPTGVNPRTVLLHGDPAREIARATEGIVDVLFTGSRGYGPMHRAHAGSVSEALLLTSTHPVVVTPRSGVASPVPPGATGDSSS